MKHDIADPALAEKGSKRIAWAERSMGVLRTIRQRFHKEQPLQGVRIAGCLHVTTETANLAITLKSGGAKVVLCASNPLSTQDDVAASLVHDSGISVFAIHGIDTDGYYRHIQSALESNPQITMDDGADLVSSLHSKNRELLEGMVGGTEETTTGVIRLKQMAREKVLKFPVISVNDALTKHLFDNRYGTGQSTLDGIIRATNKLLAGSIFVVTGYGWCGRGIADRARGMGAHVIVTEVDAVKALEAHMDGFRVMSLAEAAGIGDFFVTVTGNKHVLREVHFQKMKDGAIIANSGHFNVEIDIPALESLAKEKRTIRDHMEEYHLRDDRRLLLLGEGRLINLTAAEGHPASVMDMSFANQALSAEYLWKHARTMENDVHPVPVELDRKIALLKLKSLGIEIDTMTDAQEKYLKTWSEGT
ncbi:MAG: adenosylhomocysteinase [Acidobacteria bacterium]|nr:adenosylhomocysteinase [Acidobacteriota bacterium]